MDIGALCVATPGTWMMLQLYATNWDILQHCKLTARQCLAPAVVSSGLTRLNALGLKQTSLNAEVVVWVFIPAHTLRMQELHVHVSLCNFTNFITHLSSLCTFKFCMNTYIGLHLCICI